MPQVIVIGPEENVSDSECADAFGHSTLGLTWQIMLLIIKEKAKSVSFIRKYGATNVIVEINVEGKNYSMIPPPRHLFRAMIKLLCRVGRKTTGNPRSPFKFVYSETAQKQKLEWFNNYDGDENILDELYHLFDEVDSEIELESVEKDATEHDKKIRQRWLAIIKFVVIFALGFALVKLLF